MAGSEIKSRGRDLKQGFVLDMTVRCDLIVIPCNYFNTCSNLLLNLGLVVYKIKRDNLLMKRRFKRIFQQVFDNLDNMQFN